MRGVKIRRMTYGTAEERHVLEKVVEYSKRSCCVLVWVSSKGIFENQLHCGIAEGLCGVDESLDKQAVNFVGTRTNGLLEQQLQARRLKRPSPFKKEAIRTSILAHDKDADNEFWKRAARARNWDVTDCLVDELKKRLLAEDDESVHFPEKVDEK
eukprot:gene21934-8555_t